MFIKFDVSLYHPFVARGARIIFFFKNLFSNCVHILLNFKITRKTRSETFNSIKFLIALGENQLQSTD